MTQRQICHHLPVLRARRNVAVQRYRKAWQAEAEQARRIRVRPDIDAHVRDLLTKPLPPEEPNDYGP